MATAKKSAAKSAVAKKSAKKSAKKKSSKSANTSRMKMIQGVAKDIYKKHPEMKYYMCVKKACAQLKKEGKL